MNILTFFKYLAVTFFAFTMPIHTLVYCVVALIGLDTITGVYKAYKQKDAITSKKFGQVISKLLLYNLAILSGFIVEVMIGLSAFHLAQIIAVAISLTELKSVLENTNAITGVDLWQVVSNYLKRNQNEITKDIAPMVDSDKK
jgi:phage-related holin